MTGTPRTPPAGVGSRRACVARGGATRATARAIYGPSGQAEPACPDGGFQRMSGIAQCLWNFPPGSDMMLFPDRARP